MNVTLYVEHSGIAASLGYFECADCLATQQWSQFGSRQQQGWTEKYQTFVTQHRECATHCVSQ